MSELEGDILEKDVLDEEICRAAQKQRQGTAQNVSPPSECMVPSDGDESDNNQSLAFAKSPFFKSKGKNKTPLASTPALKRREADVEKSYQPVDRSLSLVFLYFFVKFANLFLHCCGVLSLSTFGSLHRE